MLTNKVTKVLLEESFDGCVCPLVRHFVLCGVCCKHQTTSNGLNNQLVRISLVFILFNEGVYVFFGVQRSPEDNLEFTHH